MLQEWIPAWVENCLLAKDSFSRAYHNVSQENRALLKKHIADLSKWYNFNNFPLKTETSIQSWTQGWKTLISKSPADCVLVPLPAEFSSPAQLLSTVLPPRIAGVSQVMVFKLTEEIGYWPDSLLLALELAGIEEVFDFSPKQAKSLLQEITSQGTETKLLCSVDKFSMFNPQNLDFQLDTIPLYPPSKCGIWLDGHVTPDLHALEFAHPDLYLQLFAPETGFLDAISDEYNKQKSTWQQFCSQDFDIVFAPESFHMELINRFPLVLGPGQECFWIWPELLLQRFETRKLAFSVGD